jgi:DNA-binding Xre family transcriptional regulator
MPGLSSNTYIRNFKLHGVLGKFAKNEHVSGDTIEKLCLYFNCQPGDIFEVIPEK